MSIRTHGPQSRQTGPRRAITVHRFGRIRSATGPDLGFSSHTIRECRRDARAFRARLGSWMGPCNSRPTPRRPRMNSATYSSDIQGSCACTGRSSVGGPSPRTQDSTCCCGCSCWNLRRAAVPWTVVTVIATNSTSAATLPWRTTSHHHGDPARSAAMRTATSRRVCGNSPPPRPGHAPR